MLESYLERQGFAVTVADSAEAIITAFREESIELAVIDHDHPALPGEETIAAIRARPESIGVPIVLLSSRAFVFDIERFLKLGVDRCLSKPVPLAELAETARRLIDEQRALENSRRQAR